MVLWGCTADAQPKNLWVFFPKWSCWKIFCTPIYDLFILRDWMPPATTSSNHPTLLANQWPEAGLMKQIIWSGLSYAFRSQPRKPIITPLIGRLCSRSPGNLQMRSQSLGSYHLSVHLVCPPRCVKPKNKQTNCHSLWSLKAFNSFQSYFQ